MRTDSLHMQYVTQLTDYYYEYKQIQTRIAIYPSWWFFCSGCAFTEMGKEKHISKIMRFSW